MNRADVEATQIEGRTGRTMATTKGADADTSVRIERWYGDDKKSGCRLRISATIKRADAEAIKIQGPQIERRKATIKRALAEAKQSNGPQRE